MNELSGGLQKDRRVKRNGFSTTCLRRNLPECAGLSSVNCPLGGYDPIHPKGQNVEEHQRHLDLGG